MLKILILFILFGFLVSQVFKLLFRPFIVVNQHRNQQPPFRNQKSKNPNGEVRIDHIPQNQKKKDFKGGEYVDFEEVKS